MSRQKGFTTGDFDPAFALDPRFRKLAELLEPRDYQAATGLFFHLLGATWHEAKRVAIETAVSSPPPDLVDALVKVGLVDHQRRIRRSSFNTWVGAAIKRRKGAAERQRRRREQPDGEDATSNPEVIPTDSERLTLEQKSRVTTRDSGQDRRVVKERISDESDERSGHEPARAQGAEWRVLASTVAELTGPTAGALQETSAIGRRALELTASFGIDRTLRALRDAACLVEHPDPGQLVLGARNLLRPIPNGNGHLSRAEREEREADAAIEAARRRAAARNGAPA
jgi:hypothetical protein